MQGLADSLRRMLGETVAVAMSDPCAPATGLFPEEAACVTRAVPARRASFAAGRRAARQAMASLGLPPAPITQDEWGAPQWPAGVTGTITHTVTVCLAAVQRTDGRETLGIDLEPATPLDADLIDVICTAKDRAWVMQQPNQGLAAKMVFSAKEAVFKAQYPLTKKVIGFDAVSLRWDGTFFFASDIAGVPLLTGQCHMTGTDILTVCHSERVSA